MAPNPGLTDEVPDRQHPPYQVNVVERLVQNDVVRQAVAAQPEGRAGLAVDLRRELHGGRLAEALRHFRKGARHRGEGLPDLGPGHQRVGVHPAVADVELEPVMTLRLALFRVLVRRVRGLRAGRDVAHGLIAGGEHRENELLRLVGTTACPPHTAPGCPRPASGLRPGWPRRGRCRRSTRGCRGPRGANRGRSCSRCHRAGR